MNYQKQLVNSGQILPSIATNRPPKDHRDEFRNADVDNVILADQQLMKGRSEATISRNRRDTLQLLSFTRGLPTSGSKKDLTKELLKWVCCYMFHLFHFADFALACPKSSSVH